MFHHQQQMGNVFIYACMNIKIRLEKLTSNRERRNGWCRSYYKTVKYVHVSSKLIPASSAATLAINGQSRTRVCMKNIKTCRRWMLIMTMAKCNIKYCKQIKVNVHVQYAHMFLCFSQSITNSKRRTWSTGCTKLPLLFPSVNITKHILISRNIFFKILTN